ncbi:MAG: HEAT repeat domain-containing protein [Planctomycetota bacterium]
MYRDPKLATPKVQVVFPPDLVELWMEALREPELELRRRAAAAIGRAEGRGVPGLEATIPQLMKMLARPDQDRMVRLTTAQTLVTLDARRAADLLFENLAPMDLDTAELVEPALARWGYPPAREMWLKRLDSPITFRRLHVLAIQGLTTLGETRAIPKLRELALDDRKSPSVRLAAATGLGELEKSGLEDIAKELVTDKSPGSVVDRLVAAKMLLGHRGAELEELLAELATDPIPSVQAIALRRLLRIDAELVMPLVEHAIDSSDVNVRRLAAEALIAVAVTPKDDCVASLSPLMDDPNPTLRRFVRESLVDLAGHSSLQDTVIAEGERVLGLDGWRGQQQAIQLLVALDDKAIADRLLELLDSERMEVHTTAAWGLCQLNVPSTIERIHDVFEAKSDRWRKEAIKPAAGTEIQLAHLAQLIGKRRHMPADALLRTYIPKNSGFHPTSRAAAIWSLGCLHANQPDARLARQLSQRLTDTDSDEPEHPLVRRMSAVALGRMNASQSLRALRSILRRDGIHESTGVACAWAIHRITEEPMAPVEPLVFRDRNWFLVPEIGGREEKGEAGSDE